jgi:gliding motility-associated-like protein
MNKIFSIFILLLLSLIGKSAMSQNVSNEGTDFWTVFTTHIPNGSAASSLGQLTVFVTSKENTEVTVSCGTYSETKTITANTSKGFEIPRADAFINAGESNRVLANRGIHIKVTEGMPKVSAYTHMWGQARSAATLNLPYESLGQKYFSMNYLQSSGGNSFFAMVAVEANTKLLIHDGATVVPVTLNNPGDVYQYLGAAGRDLTGVYAEVDPETSSCKRFAAFSGSTVISIGCSGSSDPLYQQLYPVASWGKNYGVVPFIDRLYILRVIAQEDNTEINYNGNTYIIDKGQYHESEQLAQATFVSANKLISVAQYSLTQGCSSAIPGRTALGDPEMVMLNPIEFNIKAVTVFSSSLQSITAKYLNVLMRSNKTSTFKINGITPNVTWQKLFIGSEYSYAQIQVYAESLTLTADDGFNATAYGFGSVESYAYSAGTNLSSNNFLTVVDNVTNFEAPNGCIGKNLDFKVTLPYELDKITWILDEGTPLIIPSPIPEINVVNGQTLYIYRYPAGIIYNEVGEHKLEVTAHVPTSATNCVFGDLVTNYSFNIYELPKSDFEVSTTTCSNSDVVFTDKSTDSSNGFSINTWQWDFGDGTYSTEQNPKHKFTAEGDFDVKLSVRSATACFSDPIATKSIRVFPQPISKFTASSKTCVNTDLRLTDQSTISTAFISSSKIVSWKWNFGDGNEIEKFDKNPFNYQYTKVGNFIITLTTTSDNGCVSEVFSQNIEIVNLPKPSFIAPEACSNDGSITFLNTSVNFDDSPITGNVTYEWNFDKENPNTTGNISNDKDGKHNYTEAKEYLVELKLTNEFGCSSVSYERFTVNSSSPKPGFIVKTDNTFCSNQSLKLINTSTIEVGKIIKLVVYKDFDNAPNVFETFEYPNIPNDILLNYEPFGTPLTKQVKVRFEAWSGQTCKDVFEEIVILKASPIINFDNIPAICQNDGVVVINQASETSGLPGYGVYSSLSEGLSADGTFNPKIAGVGIHNITYTFTADNGCPTSVTNRINVYKSPIADAGETLYVLADGEIKIPAYAEGDDLVYSWYPATGLDKTDVLNPTASPKETTEYTLTVTTGQECIATTKVKVIVLKEFTPPNSFTPNGDGVNDLWIIKHINTYPNASIEVFNRNGLRVFFSKGYDNPFDGTYMSQPLPVGVYYYKITPRNGRNVKSGSLTIIR